MYSYTSVSYTHLDVYKRQHKTISQSKLVNEIEILNFFVVLAVTITLPSFSVVVNINMMYIIFRQVTCIQHCLKNFNIHLLFFEKLL